ncbi:MAG: chromosomal replication initiator protein DnaA [Thermoguttaceae bacterium]
MTTDDMEIVSALTKSLADKVGKKRFDLWFGTSTRLDYNGRRLSINVPNQCLRDWIAGNFRRQIEEVCIEVLSHCPIVDIRVDDNLANQTSESTPEGGGAKPKGSQTSVLGHCEANLRLAQLDDASPKNAHHVSAPVKSHRFATLDTFVAGQSNRLALTSAEMVVRQIGQISPLLLYGPTSVGKTHLLEGIWSATRKHSRNLSTVYLSAEQFTSHFLEALRGSGLPNFRRKYRGVGLLIIDDLQFFMGKRATQVELLHTIDTLLREKRQLVFAADRSPAELAELGPELTTRLASGMVCRIDPPDYATRLGIVRQMARQMKLHLPTEAQEYVAAHLTNHARELSGALCRLQAVGQALGKSITLQLAAESLREMVHHSSRMVRLSDIEKAVCEVFGLEPQSLQADEKSQRVSHPRMLAMWLARKHTRAALSEIGRFFGRRSHSTVVSAQKRVERWVACGRSIDLAERAWTVDEAVRQVERRLAAG